MSESESPWQYDFEQYRGGIGFQVPPGCHDYDFTGAMNVIAHETGLNIRDHGDSWSIFSETSLLMDKEILAIFQFMEEVTGYLDEIMRDGTRALNMAEQHHITQIARDIFSGLANR